MTARKGSTRSTSFSKYFWGLFIVAFLGAFFVVAYAGLPAYLSVSYIEPASVASSTATAPESTYTPPPKPPVVHLTTPEPLKAIYMSQCVVGTPAFRNSLVKFIEESELNAVVIDIKDFTGKISFPSTHPLLKDSVSTACGALDMRTFIEELHKKDIYVIGRITVFQDPHYTKLYPEQAVQRKSASTTTGVWKDFKGLAFVDVGAKPFWDHIVLIGREAYELGFDELNFDYIRFPSDGPMSEAIFTWSEGKTKPEALEEFFKYLTDSLRPTGAVLSADLFGMVTTNEHDLNIGQVLERALPYFDGIYPMVYPSHYPSGFHGFSNVNEHAYDIVKYSMDMAVARTTDTTTKIASPVFAPIMKDVVVPATATTPTTTKSVFSGMYEKPSYPASKIRPWLQSFDYPVRYTPQMVRDQIKATEDAGLTSWLFWDAANKYNSLREALSNN